MARIPQINEGSGGAINASLEIAALVQAEEETAGMEKTVLKERTGLQSTVQVRNGAVDELSFAAGRFHSAKNRTRRELRAGAKKVAAELETERQKGEAHPVYKRILAKKTAATYLPADPEDRARALEAFVKEVADPETPANIRKLFAGVVKAIAKEQTEAKAVAAAEGKLAKARKNEETQLLKTIAAVRALVSAVQGKYSEDPARAREVLGWSEGVRRTPVQKIEDELKAVRAQLAEAEAAAKRVEAAKKEIAELEAQLAALTQGEGGRKKRGTKPSGGGGPAVRPAEGDE